MQIAFTGPRTLTNTQRALIISELDLITCPNWIVGDAGGVDKLVSLTAQSRGLNCLIYKVGENPSRWEFAQRSKRMIDAACIFGTSILYAFPNKPCPNGCKPEKSVNGNGSGTWLTIAYAVYKGMEIKIVKLDDFELPTWLEYSQIELKLF